MVWKKQKISVVLYWEIAVKHTNSISPYTSFSPPFTLSFSPRFSWVKVRCPFCLHTTFKEDQVSLLSQQFPLNLLEQGIKYCGVNSSWSHSRFPTKLSSLLPLVQSIWLLLQQRLMGVKAHACPLPSLPVWLFSSLTFYFCGSALYLWTVSVFCFFFLFRSL